MAAVSCLRVSPLSWQKLGARQAVQSLPAAQAHSRQVVQPVFKSRTVSRLGRSCTLQKHRLVVACSADAQTEVDCIEMDIKVGGMVCDGCSSRVSTALKEMDGVKTVTVDLKTGIATVEVEAVDQLDAAYNQLPRMCEAIKELGFEAEAYFSEY